MARRCQRLMWTVGVLVLCLGLGGSAIGQTLVGYPWVTPSLWTTHNETSPCTYTYYTIDTSVGRDFNTAELADVYNSFVAAYGSHIYCPDYYSAMSSTWTQNCHGYAIGVSGWLSDPSPFLWTVYWTDPAGSVFRFSGHSAYAGGEGYEYYAKCGAGPYCYHDDEQPYGAHYERWESCGW